MQSGYLTIGKLAEEGVECTFSPSITFVPQVHIYYYPKEGGEKQVIPVNYEVEQREDLSLKVIRCTVALDDSEIPGWLRPKKFDLLAHSGNFVAPYDPAAETCLSIPDADSFRYKVYGKIVAAEQAKGNQPN